MASLFFSASHRSSLRSSLISFSKPLINNLCYPSPSSIFPKSRQFSGQACEAPASPSLSPFVSNLLRILRTEIEYQAEYAPPSEPVTSFNGLAVKEHPGEQFVRLKGKFGDKEDITVEATMFDGGIIVQKPGAGDDSDGEDVRLHLSLIIDISKGEGSEKMEFVCSAWPDCLEIQKVYLIPPKGLSPKAYMGRNISDLNSKVQKALYEYLEERGITDELSGFLHRYMMNKDRSELIHWLGAVESFIQK